MAGSPLAVGVVRGAFPEREEERLSKLDEFGVRWAGAAARWLRAQRRPWRRTYARL